MFHTRPFLLNQYQYRTIPISLVWRGDGLRMRKNPRIKQSHRMHTPCSGGPSRTESDYLSLSAQVGSQHQNAEGSLHQFSPPIPELHCTLNNLTIGRCCVRFPLCWILRARTTTIDFNPFRSIGESTGLLKETGKCFSFHPRRPQI